MQRWQAGQKRRSSRRRQRAALVAAFVVVSVSLGSISAVAAPSGTGSISGHVVDGSGNPLSGICVNVDGGPGLQTDGSGAYTITALDTGAYKVGFSDCNASPQYVSQWYLGRPSSGAADPIPVTDGVDTPLADVTLVLGATVSGTVRGPGGGGLTGICVDANVPRNGNFDWIAGTTTGPGGTYTLGQLPATDIRIHFRDCGAGPFLDQWYLGQTDPNSSTPIVLAAGASQAGVDAQLTRGMVVSGRVTDGSGHPIAGINVNVNPTDSGGSAWGQTDSTGRYTTSPIAPGSYRVQFQDSSSNPVWAAQFWNGQPSRNLATILTLSGSDGPVRGNVNATLAPAASIAGTVTAPGGGPAANVCVTALVDTPDGADWLGNATTAGDGTYSIGGIPALTVKVYFQDCNNVGPYVDKFWKDGKDYDGATPLTLRAGVRRSGVDAQLTTAAVITGVVTDNGGHPLGGICAQATTATFFGGMARTGSDGRYSISLGKPGSYRVQFVDCNDTPHFAGEWWDNQPTASTARIVTVGSGQTMSHVDAILASGATGSISGRVVNVNGAAMTTSCIVAYIPNSYAKFAPVSADGSYAVTGLPSGTYALAFLGCGHDDPSPVVQDPRSSVTSYQAVWWNGAPIDLPRGDGGPDPIAQGAHLLTVSPGQDLTGYDWCFGCSAITITGITPGRGSLTVAFTTSLLPASGAPGAIAPTAARSYTVTCTSSTGGVTGVATGPSSPITVTGLTPGATYTCQVAASDGSVTVASSPVSDAAVSASSSGSDPAAETVSFPAASPSTASPSTGGMARTGANSSDQARVGLASLLLGIILILLTRARRSRAIS